MRWAKSEYILKGVFLGLLLFVALQKGLDWAATGRVALWLGGGFLIALVLAAARQLRDITGVVLGLAGAAIDYLVPLRAAAATAGTPLPPEAEILGYCVFGGAVFGYCL